MTPKLAASLCGDIYGTPDAAMLAAGGRGLKEIVFLDEGSTQVLLGQLTTGESIVVFRGTKIDPIQIYWQDIAKFRVLRKILKSLADIGSDIDAKMESWGGKGLVHSGFHDALNCVSLGVHAYLGNHRSDKVQVIGHSLGGALAQLYGGLYAGELADLTRVMVTTFGCPAVGNAEACRHIDENCQSNVNWEYCSDIVVRLLNHVPLGYRRPGRTEYVNRKGKTLYHATRRQKFVDRSILRAQRFMSGGPKNAFRAEWEHHSIHKWQTQKCLGAK